MQLLLVIILGVFITLVALFIWLYGGKPIEILSALQQHRKLTPAQQEQFLKMLYESPRGTVYVKAARGDSESIAFAKELDTLLNRAGWVTQGVSQAVFTGNPKGLILTTNGTEETLPCANVLQNTLKFIGLPAAVEVYDENQTQPLLLIVGHNPNQNRWLSIQFMKGKHPEQSDAEEKPSDQYWTISNGPFQTCPWMEKS
jgi:hypothetical protein